MGVFNLRLPSNDDLQSNTSQYVICEVNENQSWEINNAVFWDDIVLLL
jgi:hypothetical protein